MQLQKKVNKLQVEHVSEEEVDQLFYALEVRTPATRAKPLDCTHAASVCIVCRKRRSSSSRRTQRKRPWRQRSSRRGSSLPGGRSSRRSSRSTTITRCQTTMTTRRSSLPPRPRLRSRPRKQSPGKCRTACSAACRTLAQHLLNRQEECALGREWRGGRHWMVGNGRYRCVWSAPALSFARSEEFRQHGCAIAAAEDGWPMAGRVMRCGRDLLVAGESYTPPVGYELDCG